MKFSVGNRVQIIPQEQGFYTGMYNLTTYRGAVQRNDGGCVYVKFDNSKRHSLAVLRKDLELTKNQQLLFEFMQR